jgi:hypothetical protein
MTRAAIGSIAGHGDSLWSGQMAAARGARWRGISGKAMARCRTLDGRQEGVLRPRSDEEVELTG